MQEMTEKPATASPAKMAKYQRRYGEIIDAAAAVFAEKGYHGSSTKDIADRLGIGRMGEHGALADAYATYDILAELCARALPSPGPP